MPGWHRIIASSFPGATAPRGGKQGARGQDSDDSIAKRLDRARKEVERYREFDYLIVNDDLERADNTILAIALAERAARRVMQERAKEILDSFGG